MDSQCPKCKKDYDSEDNVPVILACSHRMCAECIQREYGSNNKLYICETCKQVLNQNPRTLKEDLQLIQNIQILRQYKENNIQQLNRQISYTINNVKQIKQYKKYIISEFMKQLNQHALQNVKDNLKEANESVKKMKKLIYENNNKVQDQIQKSQQLQEKSQILYNKLQNFQISKNIFQNLTDLKEQVSKEQKQNQEYEEKIKKLEQQIQIVTKSNKELEQQLQSINEKQKQQVKQEEVVQKQQYQQSPPASNKITIKFSSGQQETFDDNLTCKQLIDQIEQRTQLY